MGREHQGPGIWDSRHSTRPGENGTPCPVSSLKKETETRGPVKGGDSRHRELQNYLNDPGILFAWKAGMSATGVKQTQDEAKHR